MPSNKALTDKALDHIVYALKQTLGKNAVTIKGSQKQAFKLCRAWIGDKRQISLNIGFQHFGPNDQDDTYRIWAISDKKLGFFHGLLTANFNRTKDEMVLFLGNAHTNDRTLTYRHWERRIARTQDIFEHISGLSDTPFQGEQECTLDLADKIAKAPGLDAEIFMKAVQQSLDGQTEPVTKMAPYSVEEVKTRRQINLNKERKGPQP